MSETDSNHTVFTLGRGNAAEALGEFRDYLLPRDLTRLPVGRELLAATTAQQVRTCFARFALAWDVAGCDTFIPPRRDTRVPEASPRHVPWVPYAHRQDVYAFDEGRWLLWQATDEPQWHTVTLEDPERVRTHPVARAYGPNFAQTSTLDLTHLAVWIMAEATTRLHRGDLVFSAHVHRGQDRCDPSIHITAGGVLGSEVGVITVELESIAQAHNWSNPCDPEDVRFRFSARCVDEAAGKDRETLVVVTDDDLDD